MALTPVQAKSIAALLNARNELTVPYDRDKVMSQAEDYLCRLSDDGEVIGCVQIKKVQWYQYEVLHLTVGYGHERRGHAKALLEDAEALGRARRARILQCTIRFDNVASKALFQSYGYIRVNAFLNEVSGKIVEVWQKALVPAT